MRQEMGKSDSNIILEVSFTSALKLASQTRLLTNLLPSNSSPRAHLLLALLLQHTPPVRA